MCLKPRDDIKRPANCDNIFDDGNNIVRTVQRLNEPRARLEAAGFHPFIANKNAAGWIGGTSTATLLRIEVPENEAADVKAIVDKRTAAPIANYDALAAIPGLDKKKIEPLKTRLKFAAATPAK